MPGSLLMVPTRTATSTVVGIDRIFRRSRSSSVRPPLTPSTPYFVWTFVGICSHLSARSRAFSSVAPIAIAVSMNRRRAFRKESEALSCDPVWSMIAAAVSFAWEARSSSADVSSSVTFVDLSIASRASSTAARNAICSRAALMLTPLRASRASVYEATASAASSTIGVASSIAPPNWSDSMPAIFISCLSWAMRSLSASTLSAAAALLPVQSVGNKVVNPRSTCKPSSAISCSRSISRVSAAITAAVLGPALASTTSIHRVNPLSAPLNAPSMRTRADSAMPALAAARAVLPRPRSAAAPASPRLRSASRPSRTFGASDPNAPMATSAPPPTPAIAVAVACTGPGRSAKALTAPVAACVMPRRAPFAPDPDWISAVSTEPLNASRSPARLSSWSAAMRWAAPLSFTASV